MTPGERHSERPDGRQEEVKLDVEVVDRLDVERVKELCGHDVQLNLGEALSRTRPLAEAERKNQTGKLRINIDINLSINRRIPRGAV